MIDSDMTSVPSALEISRLSSISSELAHENSVTDPSGDSSDPSTGSDEEETTTIDHSHNHHKNGYHHNSESDYSGKSHTDDDSSGFSDSLGTSQATGEASTLSTVSFTVKEYKNTFVNSNDGAFVRILDRDEPTIRAPRSVDEERQE